jgi:hypothetical protein
MAFDMCLDLTSLYIPKSVTEIGEMVFRECRNLTSLTVDEKNPYFRSVHNVLLDKGQTTLIKCPNIFEGLYSIPRTVERICKRAFEGCHKITSIEIPGAMSMIEAMAFIGCSGINAFIVDDANLSFSSKEGVLFNREQTELVVFPSGYKGDYSIPYGVTTIRTCAFDCTFDSYKNLTSITIPNSVTIVEDGRLLGCGMPPTFKIPDGKSLRLVLAGGCIKSSSLVDV